ncbi:PIN domain-containing protein [Spirosoma telluris]|uniref:PIN domain-containing protein n=1 Tax=Spirosoma telluris TaxID=2183553 RepID=UPI002FC2C6EB
MGKLPDFRVSVDELIAQTRQDGFRIIQLDNLHIVSYDLIPLYPDHRDPFDRLILATALAEKMPIISADEKFWRYRDIVEVIW